MTPSSLGEVIAERARTSGDRPYLTFVGDGDRVDLTAADSMMGQPLPLKMHIEVRLDTDGNAMTKEPTDLVAGKDGVALGDALALSLANGH